MKNRIISAAALCTVFLTTCYGQPINTDCKNSNDWTITQRFPTLELTCVKKNMTCDLIDESGGDPAEHNFYDNTDWTFTTSAPTQVYSGQCKSDQQTCAINYSRHTCAYLYAAHVPKLP